MGLLMRGCSSFVIFYLIGNYCVLCHYYFPFRYLSNLYDILYSMKRGLVFSPKCAKLRCHKIGPGDQG